MQQYLFNPYMNAQQRLYQMEQQYPQLAQPNQVQNMVAIPVSNIEEANAFRVDLNGTPTFFYNAGKNEIYLKRTNTQTGLADFFIFSKVEQPTSDVKAKDNMKLYEKDFKTLNDKIDGFNIKFDELLTLFTTEHKSEEKRGVKNVK